MERFTDEEFKVFCERLEKEIKVIDRIFNGELEALDDVEDETLKSIIEDLIEMEEQNDESLAADLEQKLNNRIREILSIDKMTDIQFEDFLSNEEFFEEVVECYAPIGHKEEFDKLPDSKKNLYKEKDKFENIKLDIERKYSNSIREDWGSFSEDIQKKYFQEIMNVSEDIETQINIWCSSKEEIQKQNADFFKILLEKCQDDINKKCILWKDTLQEFQQASFEEVMGDFEKDFENKLKLWKITNPKVQQDNLEHIIGKFNEDVYSQIKILKGTVTEVQKEKEDFIFEVINSMKSEMFELNQELRKQLQELEENGDSINNFEHEKEKINSQIGENYKILSSLFISISEELQNLKKIRGSINEQDEFFYEFIKSIKDKVSPEVWIKRENFEILYEVYTKGKILDEKKYDKVIELFKLNNNIINTINFDFLREEDILTDYTDEQLLTITNHPEVQQFIYSNCYANNNTALKESIKYLLKNDTNWIISLYCIKNTLRFMNGSKELLENVSQLRESNLTDDFIQQLLSVLSEEYNYFNIKNYEEVCNYTNIRNEICEKIFNGNFEDIPETLKIKYQNNKNNLYKFALLEHQFGISLDEATRLVKDYGIDAKELPEGEIKDYLILLDEIINCENIEDIIKEVNIKVQNGEIEPWLKSVDSRNVRGHILNLYENMYNDVLYDPKKEEKNRTEVYVDGQVKEHEIDIYELDDDFYMCVRNEAAFYDTGEHENYKEYYEMGNMKCRSNSESVIRQDFIGIAGAELESFDRYASIIVGYSGIRKNQLVTMSIEDIGVGSGEFSLYDTVGGRSVGVRTPNQLINNSKDFYNEFVTDRYIKDENGRVEKLKPDFVIWIKDSEEDKNEIGEKTKKAAAQLGIPIVVINRERFAKREYARIEVMKKLIAGEEIEEPEYQQYLDEYKDLSQSELKEQIKLKYKLNRNGLRNSGSVTRQRLMDKYFSDARLQEINEMIDRIDNKAKTEAELIDKTKTYTLLQQYLDKGIDDNLVALVVEETSKDKKIQNTKNSKNTSSQNLNDDGFR